MIVLRRCSGEAWDITLQAFIDARARTGATATVVSTLPENLPESVREHLLAHGIALMQGLAECLAAIHAAAVIGPRQAH